MIEDGPRFCPRCLTRRNSYASCEEMFCYRCKSLYVLVFAELAEEARILREKADTYQGYVGDCRPWRHAAELVLPLYALNRLALDARAFPPAGPGVQTYHGVSGPRGERLSDAPGRDGRAPAIYAGNPEVLSQAWPLTSGSLERGLEHLKKTGKAEPVARSPFDGRVELWLVNDPYKRPDLNRALEEAGLNPRRPATGRKRTKKRRRSPVAA